MMGREFEPVLESILHRGEAKIHPPKSPCVGGVRYAADGGNGSVVAAVLPEPIELKDGSK